MSGGLLPQTVNTRKAVTREACYRGVLGAAQLPQLREMLPGDSQPVSVAMRFFSDEQGRKRISVELDATVQLVCQRCLEPFTSRIASRSELGIVRSDEEALHLPGDCEPLIALEETDLWRVAEEELALALPVVAYHPEGECSAVPGAPQSALEPGDLAGEETQNPFGVLSTLLDNTAHGSVDRNDRGDQQREALDENADGKAAGDDDREHPGSGKL
jgi:uncharacterized protein